MKNVGRPDTQAVEEDWIMRKSTAAAGATVFFIVAPGVIAGLIPWWLTGWGVRGPLLNWTPVRVIGVVLMVTGAAVLISAFARFVVEGAGTPAPVAPTERLVVGGLYRYVRNPMYLAVLAIIVGQALALGQAGLFVYAFGVLIAFGAFVRWYEEPALQRRYGAQYETYRLAVPAWVPRLRPWKPEGHGTTARESTPSRPRTL
jgi:protein-S-isoprenylcysteine O-methyltransferase Ste14